MPKQKNQPTIWGRSHEIVRDYPMIEIMGLPGIGKTLIAQRLARALRGTSFSFPNLDPESPTGSPMLQILTTNPQFVLEYPEWWGHIYLANIYEKKPEIVEALSQGPVVAVNYIRSFTVWSRSSGFRPESGFSGFSSGLPITQTSFTLWGGNIRTPGDLPVEHPHELLERLRMGFKFSYKELTEHIRIPKDGLAFTCLPRVVERMARKIAKKYQLEYIRPNTEPRALHMGKNRRIAQ